MSRVAKDIVAYCSRCEMDLTHVIVALNGDRIVRVLCKTCKKEHAYRPSKGSGDPLTRRKSSPIEESRSASAEWEQAIEQNKHLHSKVYNVAACFEAGDKIDHRTFGLGLVRRVIGLNKMEVLFKDGAKLLVRGDSKPLPQHLSEERKS